MKTQTGERQPASMTPRQNAQREESERRARRFSERHAPGLMPAARSLEDTGKEFFGEPGEAIPEAERRPLEARLGHNLAEVRIHRGPAAEAMAAGAEARALTVGEHIAFAEGEYQPGSPEGRSLLAHEVAHTREQTTAPARQPKANKKTGIGRTAPKEEYTVGEGVLPEDDAVLFEFDSADLTPTALAALKKLAEAHQGPVTVSIPAYASAEGDVDYNRNLSAHRAAAIKRALQPLLAPEAKFELHAQGETTEFGKPENNRRAGIKITETAAEKPYEFKLFKPKTFDLGLGLKYDLTLKPPPDFTFRPVVPFPVLPSPSLTPPDPFLLPDPRVSGPFLTPQPDLSAAARAYATRGIATDLTTFDSMMSLWSQSYQLWAPVLGPEHAKTLADMTVSSAAEAEAIRRQPSMMDIWKQEDKARGTDVTGVQIPLEKVVPKVIDFFKKKDKK